MTTAGGGHRKRKTIKRGVGGFLRGAPLNIYPDWRGLGMQWSRLVSRKGDSELGLTRPALGADYS